jgi:Fe-Mn family superoxide dismutase
MNPESSLTRRDLIKGLGAGAAIIGLGSLGSRAQAAAAPAPAPAPAAAAPAGPFSLPKLAYAYDALEPHIDAQTMQIHHSRHHQAYINNANTALKDQAALAGMSGIQLLQRLPSVPDAIRTAVRNNVGGHVNHTFFWEIMGPGGAGAPTGALAAAIEKGFGSLDEFKTKFAAAATGRFGSGWAWLNVRAGALVIESTANQDSPLSDNAVPVLGLDVWEHAYYLKYQNLRADYVKAFWNVVNWRQVEANFAAAGKS